MATSYEEAVRLVMLHTPDASSFLAGFWVQQGFAELCSRRRWSWLRAEGQITVAAPRSGTATFAVGSTAVTGGTIAFVAGDIGRQLRVLSGVPYTISDVAAGNATLDRAWGGAAGAQTCTVLDAYVVMPDDFGSFWVVIDPVRERELNIWMTEEELAQADPLRQSTANPLALVANRPSTLTATLNRARYELWPYASSAAAYPYLYSRRPPTLVDSDQFAGPLRARTDILVSAALAFACEWPGPRNAPNPYFNLKLAQYKRANLEALVLPLEREDEELYLTGLETVWTAGRFRAYHGILGGGGGRDQE